MSVVPKVSTPIAEQDLVEVLKTGHEEAYGQVPSQETLACAWAQIALEHARGRAVWCNNLGNITASKDWPGDVYELTTKERVSRNPDVWKELTLRYRAWKTPEDGAVDYWLRLTGLYRTVLPIFASGDPRAAAKELARLRYYTGSEFAYETSMQSLYSEFMRRFSNV